MVHKGFKQGMRTGPERQVVVEIEHTVVVRKRANTQVRFCRGCRRPVDFLPLAKAAELFDLEPVRVFDFICTHSCHFVIGNEGEIYICLADLLTAMNKRIKKVKLLGETK